MALGDKVDKLQENVAALAERLDNALKTIDAMYAAQREHDRNFGDVRRESEREIALLKREIDEGRKRRDEERQDRTELSRRVWSFGPSIVGSLVSGLIAALVAYFVARR